MGGWISGEKRRVAKKRRWVGKRGGMSGVKEGGWDSHGGGWGLERKLVQ